jgi:membrane protease YdiL (CAAX protease family)
MESKRNSAWADLGIMAAVLLGATIVVSAGMAVVRIAFPALGQGPFMFITYTGQFVLAIVGAWLWLRFGRGYDARLRFRASWADGPLILGGMVIATAAGVVIEPLLNLMPDRYMELLESLIGRGGWTVLTTVVAAPVLEEVFFRGLVLETLARRWSGRWAVVASAALFGLVHAPILPQMVNAFVIALVMGYIYLMTRSLIPVIVIHAINNGLAYLMLELTGSQGVDTRDLIANDNIYWFVYAAGTVVFVAAVAWMDRRARTKTAEITLNRKNTGDV